MTHKELKTLSNLPENELNGKLIGLFSEVWKFHSRGFCLSPFTWDKVSISADGTLRLTCVEQRPYDNDTRLRNLRDYAGVLFCAATGSKSTAKMDDEAFGKIDSDVLREIVLTLIGEGDAVTPMIRKLRRPYVDTETFFSDCNPRFRKSEQPEPDEVEKAERRHNILTRSFFATMAAMMAAAVIGCIVYVNNPGEKPLVTNTYVPEEETVYVDTPHEKYYPGPAEYDEAAKKYADEADISSYALFRTGGLGKPHYLYIPIPSPKTKKTTEIANAVKNYSEKTRKRTETIRKNIEQYRKFNEDIKKYDRVKTECIPSIPILKTPAANTIPKEQTEDSTVSQ